MAAVSVDAAIVQAALQTTAACLPALQRGTRTNGAVSQKGTYSASRLNNSATDAAMLPSYHSSGCIKGDDILVTSRLQARSLKAATAVHRIVFRS